MSNTTPIFSENGISFFLQSNRANWGANLRSELIKFISQTKRTLDCAIYDFHDIDAANALKKIYIQNGIKLRMAYNKNQERVRKDGSADPQSGQTKRVLTETGLIDVSTEVDEGGYLMHDKFLIRDGASIWTGSANFSPGAFDLQDNNCISVNSAELATIYKKVFNDLLIPDHRHLHEEGHHPSPPSQTVNIGNMSITPYFSPSSKEGIEEAIISELEGAKRVRILSMVISDQGILDALAKFQNSTFDIRGVYDSSEMDMVMSVTNKDPSLYWFMKDKRFVAAKSHPYGTQPESDFMHNKVIVINEDTVITGSYNLSEKAESNDENLLIIKSPDVAKVYSKYVDDIYNHPQYPNM